MTERDPQDGPAPDAASAGSFLPQQGTEGQFGASLGPPLSPEVAQIARVVGGLLEQQARDAQAARAQARAVVEAIEGLAKSHEFLGVQLREERARSRSLVIAVGVVPLVLAGVVAALWISNRDDASARAAERADLDSRLRTLQTDVARDQVGELRAVFDERTKALAADVEATRGELDRSRRGLDEEREARSRTDAAAAERLAQADRDRRELDGIRSELRTLNELAGAERARADALAKALIEAARAEPRQPAASPSTGAVPSSDGAPGPAGPRPGTPASADVGPGRRPAPTSPRTLPAPVARAPGPADVLAPPSIPPSIPAATRDPDDLAALSSRINTLLDGATGAAKYRLEGIEGVSGHDLLGVRLVGRDDEGTILRTVVAPRAEIVVAADGTIRITCRDGQVLVADRQVPFFDGVYTLRLAGTAAAWRESGLTCVRFE